MNSRKKVARLIKTEKYSKSWYMSRSLAAVASHINSLPDAAQVLQNKRRSVPREMLPMVF